MNKIFYRSFTLVFVTVLATGGFSMFAGTALAILNSDATLSSLVISSGSLSPAFSSDVFSYTDNVENVVGSVTVTPSASQYDAIITVNGNFVTSGSAYGPISLNVGSNTISITVYGRDVLLDLFKVNVGRTDCGSGNAWCNGADVNQDTNVDGADLDIIKADYNNGATERFKRNVGREDCNSENFWCDRSDMDQNTNVDGADLDIIKANLGLINTYTINVVRADCSQIFDLFKANVGRTDCGSGNAWCNGADVNQDTIVDGADLDIIKASCPPIEIGPSISSNPSVITGLTSFGGETQTIVKSGDANGDDNVDWLDFMILILQWGHTGSDLSGDLNHDGVVDGLDFSLLMANWNK